MRVLETERLALRWLEAAEARFVAREYIVDGPRKIYARLAFGLYMIELRGMDTDLITCARAGEAVHR